MLYKFKSKASGDVIMTSVHGDALVQLLGKAPGMPGILTVEHMPAALAALDAAIAQAEAVAKDAQNPSSTDSSNASINESTGDDLAGDPTPASRTAVSLRQRLWPFIDLVKRSQTAGVEVVWGV